MISNGWLLDEKTIDLALKSGLTNCAISIDGPEDIHNKIRCSGSFEKSVKALSIMKKKGLPSAVVTTVFSSNIDRLYEMIPILEKNGVNFWQFQIGLPMGNMKRADVIKPGQVDQLLNFIHSLLSESTLNPCLSDCIGYNTKKYEELIKSYNGSHTSWTGCNAGKNLFGIFHDGSIVGCTSIRDKDLIEGNIRKTPLKTIWTRPRAFFWNRDFSVDDLKGFRNCRKCVYDETCLGGCQNVKKTMTGDLSDNPYCVHRTKIENNDNEQAIEIILNGIEKNSDFKSTSKELLAYCKAIEKE